MKVFAGAALAALLVPAAANAGDMLLLHDFQNYGQAGWIAGPKGAVGTSEYKGNVSLRLTGGASATNMVNTVGEKDVTISVSFAALDVGKHGGCSLEASVDDGANWSKVYRIGTSDADGIHLHSGSDSEADWANREKLMLRLNNTGPTEANCWADNIQVTGTPTGAPRPAYMPPVGAAASSSSAPAAPQAGSVVWDPNAVK